MKQIIIAGRGGFGLEVVHYILDDLAAGKLRHCVVKGVIDDLSDVRLPAYSFPVPYIGSIREYVPSSEDVVLIAIGTPRIRRAVHQTLAATGTRFFTYVHSSAYVARDAELGEGVIICPNSIVNSRSRVGAFSAVNVFCSVGHGATIGEFSVLSPYAALNGGASIGSDCFLGTRATIYPGVSVGNLCVVDSHGFVKAEVGDRKIVSVRGKYLVVDNRFT